MDKTFGAGKWRETSGHRDPEHNRAVGGVPNSMHLQGTAAFPGARDIVVPGMNSAQIAAKLRAAHGDFAQLLPEKDHLHAVTNLKPWELYTPEPAAPSGPKPWEAFSGAPQASGRPAQPEGQGGGQFMQDMKDRFHEGHVAADQGLKKMTSTRPKGSWDALKTTAGVVGGALDAALSPAMAVGDQVNRAVAPRGVNTPLGKVSPRDMTDIEAIAVPVGGLAYDITKSTKAVKAATEVTRKLIDPITKATKDFLAPATSSKSASGTANLIRQSRGTHQLMADQAASKLVEAQRKAGNLSTDESRSLIGYIESRGKGAKPPDMGEHRFDASTPQGRARAKMLSPKIENTRFKEAADTLRDVYRHYRARAQYVIARNVGAAPRFIEDYYTHMWKESPDKVRSSIGAFYRQGSGRNFRQRHIPTIADGIEAGLTPKYENPFEATMHYAQNMSRFLTTHDVQAAMKEAGHAMWFSPGEQPEGWLKLDGIMTERVPRGSRGGRPSSGASSKGEGASATDGAPKPKGGLPAEPLRDYEEPARLPGRNAVSAAQTPKPGAPQIEDAAAKARRLDPEKQKLLKGPKAPTADRRPIKQVLYAHPDAARVYNNFISKGLEGTAVGPAFKAARQAENGMVMLKLGLSAFHGAVMGKEGMVSELARAYTEASRAIKPALKGDMREAGARLKSAGASVLRTPVAPLIQYAKGRRFQQALLKAGNPGQISDPVMKAFYNSGQQLRMDDFYRTRGAGSFFQSFARGSFKKDFTAAVNRVFGDNPKMLDRAHGAIDLTANAIQSVAAPLFEHIIPSMKQGAFAGEMQAFIRANPEATEAEITAHARKIGDSIDNRFGELAQDNLFWHRWMKQIAQTTLTSFGWDLGTVREIGGGLKDIPESVKGAMNGSGITARTAYVAALATFVPLQNAIYQRLKTGKGPEEPMDLIAPKTGGTTTHGDPERAAFPGYEKDVYAYTMNPEGPGQEIGNKLSPLAQFGRDYISGKDYRGLPLLKPGDVPEGGKSWEESLAEDLAQRLMPISLGNQKKRGSNIGSGERAFGIRPSPYYIEDRDQAIAGKRKRDTKAWKTRVRADQRAQSELEP